ncbi:HAMP domain-containing protein [Desulfobacterota bacterium M19]
MNKRKTYYIKNSAQSKFIFRFTSISIIGGILALTAFNYLAYKKIDSVLYSMRLPHVSPGNLLWNEMLYSNLFVIFFTLIVFFILARGLYKKIHGPLKKLDNDIKRMSSGDFDKHIALRHKDEFLDFAEELNAMSHELNNRFKAMQKAGAEIERAAEILDSTREQDEQLKKIKDECVRLSNIVKSFKI